MPTKTSKKGPKVTYVEREELKDRLRGILDNVIKLQESLPTVVSPEGMEELLEKEDIELVEEVERGQVYDFGDIGEFDVDAIDNPSFDFDALFDQALSVEKELRKYKKMGLHTPLLLETQKKIKELANPIKRLSDPTKTKTGLPVAKDYSEEIRKVIHQEFITPGRSLGMRVWHIVAEGLGTLKHKYPDEFEDAFSLAMLYIRKREDELFGPLIGVKPWDASKITPTSPEVKKAYNEIVHILDRYLREVLGYAEKNKKNLMKRLGEIEAALGHEEFQKQFRKAYQKDREVEDQAFRKWLRYGVMGATMKPKKRIVEARNVVNVDELQEFLKQFQPEDAKLKKWIKSNLKNYLISDYEAQRYSRKPKSSDPEWLKKALESGQELYELKLDTRLKDQIDHALDYLAAQQLSDYSRVSPKDAFKKSLEWVKKLKGTGGKDVMGKDVEKIMDLSDGFQIVELKSQESILREGTKMGHCLKDPKMDWYKTIQKGGRLMSLRDSKNEPHATFEINKSGDILQAKGKQNQAVVEKYQRYIIEFLRAASAI